MKTKILSDFQICISVPLDILKMKRASKIKRKHFIISTELSIFFGVLSQMYIKRRKDGKPEGFN